MRSRLPASLSLGASTAVALLAVVSGQEPQPASSGQTFTSGTSIVAVDVRVVDRLGHPITDLAQEEFTILEDGQPQQIRHFSAHAFTADPTPSATPIVRHVADAGSLEPQTHRTFLIVMGNGRLQVPAKGVDGMIDFVRTRLLPQDGVAVAAWNRATEFTTDHSRILGVLERFRAEHERIDWIIRMRRSGLGAMFGVSPYPEVVQQDINRVFDGPDGIRGRSLGTPGIPNQARMDQDIRETTDLLLNRSSSSAGPVEAAQAEAVGMTLDEFLSSSASTRDDVSRLYSGLEYLRHMAGEKHLLFVTERGIGLPRVEDERDLAREAADARIAVHIIHTCCSGGIERSRTSRMIAQITGGRYFAARYWTAADDADWIEESTRFRYLLGYSSTNTRSNDEFRRIEVRVSRPGATVLYRQGYYARPLDHRLIDRRGRISHGRIAAAARNPRNITDLSLQASARNAHADDGSRRVDVDATVALDRIKFIEEEGEHVGAIDVAVFALSRFGAKVGESWQRIDITTTPDRLEDVRRIGAPYRVSVPVTGSAREVKIIVYDYASDLSGSAVVHVQ